MSDFIPGGFCCLEGMCWRFSGSTFLNPSDLRGVFFYLSQLGLYQRGHLFVVGCAAEEVALDG